MEERLDEVMGILLEQEAALFNISSQDINETLVASLQQAKAANKKAQDKLKEIIYEHQQVTSSPPSSPIASPSPLTPSSPLAMIPSFSQSAPTSPVSRVQSSPSGLSLSLSWNMEAPPPKKFGRSLTLRERIVPVAVDAIETTTDEPRPKELKRRVTQFFSPKSKSAINLPSPLRDDEDHPTNMNLDNNNNNNESNIQRVSSPGRQKLTISYSAADLFRRRKDKPKKKEEVESYFQMYENSKMLFEKKRELLKSSGDPTKFIQEQSS